MSAGHTELAFSDLAADFDRLVHGGLPQSSEITIAIKPNATAGGNPAAVIAFDVTLPDGSVRQVQATTTVRLLQFIGKELIKRHGDVDAPKPGAPSGVHDFNPGSIIGDQLREQWQKFVALLVWKLARQGVSITHKDIERFAQENARGESILYYVGQSDRINFKIVDAKKAEALAAYDQLQRGHA